MFLFQLRSDIFCLVGIRLSAYKPAEEQTITELKELGKPFVVLVNTTKPYSDEATPSSKKAAEPSAMFTWSYLQRLIYSLSFSSSWLKSFSTKSRTAHEKRSDREAARHHG